MSKTILTKGWPGPKGKCDICNKKKATHWFGDTSVALCNDESCAQINGENWRRTVREVEEEYESQREQDSWNNNW